MSSLLDHGLIRTTAVERIVAPIACHLCHLMLLCDTEEHERFSQLEVTALAVANAAENMAAVASRQINETDDEILRVQMSSLLEPVTVSGQYVLLAAQKLSIQPNLTENKEELVSAMQHTFLAAVKVLLVNDDASVRKVVSAADQVLKRLSELGSSSDVESLLAGFQGFSNDLLSFNSLTIERANALLNPSQSKQLSDSLDTLRRCISMLHTALCATIKHPSSEQVQAAKRFILDKVENTVCDIIGIVKSENQTASLGPCGYYTNRKNSLLQVLSGFSISSVPAGNFDSLVRDLVFHCMVVANPSRREHQVKLVFHCQRVLHFWSDIQHVLKSAKDALCHERPLQNACSFLEQQIHLLDKAMVTTIQYQLLETVSAACSVFEELCNVLVGASSAETDLTVIKSLVEDFIPGADQLIEVATFISALAADAKSLENVENSRVFLSRINAGIAPLSPELTGDLTQSLQKLHEMCEKWDEGKNQLLDAVCDVMDVREFTAIAISEMANDHHGCDSAFREQCYKLFSACATNLICHMKLVIQLVRLNLDKSNDPIYRNGLLVLLKQAQVCQNKVGLSVKEMLLGNGLNVEVYSTFSDNVSDAIQNFGILRQGLDGQRHPHLLSPLRKGVCRPVLSESHLREEDSCEPKVDRMKGRSDSLDLEVLERDFQSEHKEEHSGEESLETGLPHKYDRDDLRMPAGPGEPRQIQIPFEVDLLPLVHEVLTVTKGKDVAALNRSCTGVLELSNCYAQAAKEALAVVDFMDCIKLENSRAEIVSLTPLLIQTAKETAMKSVTSADAVAKLSTRFSDLIRNIRKVLLPAAGSWFHAVYSEFQGKLPITAGRDKQWLREVVNSCADVAQRLTLCHFTFQSDSQETWTVLQSKLIKAQNNTRCLLEFSASGDKWVDQLEGLCILWGLSVQILFHSVDKILGASTAMNQPSPQKQQMVLCENSLRLQEAGTLSSLNCKSAFKSKQILECRDELKALTEAYLRAAEDRGVMPDVLRLAKAEISQRRVLIEIRVLSGHLSKVNKDYGGALQNFVSAAFCAAQHSAEREKDDARQRFENSAQVLSENVKSAVERVDNCLNYVRDSRARSNLRIVNDQLLFQLSDIISRARLIAETHCICDTLHLDVQIQCWSAKAHHMVEEIRKRDGIHQEAKDHIRAALQGRTRGDVKDFSTACVVEEAGSPSDKTETSLQMQSAKIADTTEPNIPSVVRYESGNMQHDDVVLSFCKGSLAYNSLFLKQESDSWDSKDNRIVQVTRKMADTICNMTQYLRNRGPLLNKEAFVDAAKDVISNCQCVTQFIRVIADHCLDKKCTAELSVIVEQILTITNQLSIISSVNAVTPGCKSSNEILVKNAQNLLQTLLHGVHAAETACISGFRQPEPNSDEAEATALCFQWKRKLELHRAQETSNLDTDELGLRRTSPCSVPPSLAPPVHDGCKLKLSLSNRLTGGVNKF